MTASAAKSGFSSTLSRDGNIIAEVTKIGGVSVSAGEILKTHLTSDYGYVESMQGLRDPGDMALEGNCIPSDTAGQIGLLTDFDAGTVVAYIITLTAISATLTFTAWVKAFNLTGEITPEGALIFKATLRITGKPVLAVTASTGLTTPFFAISESAVINPAKAGTTYLYSASVLTAIASVTVTPTAAAGVITVNGNVVATGAASSAITLGAAGSITTITIVVTETSKTAKTYVIHLTRL